MNFYNDAVLWYTRRSKVGQDSPHYYSIFTCSQRDINIRLLHELDRVGLHPTTLHDQESYEFKRSREPTPYNRGTRKTKARARTRAHRRAEGFIRPSVRERNNAPLILKGSKGPRDV